MREHTGRCVTRRRWSKSGSWRPTRPCPAIAGPRPANRRFGSGLRNSDLTAPASCKMQWSWNWPGLGTGNVMAMGAAIANTYRTNVAPAAVGQREDLSDTIERIDPTETPMYSNADKRTAKAILTEWQVQELIAPAKNVQPEGFEATFAAPKPTDRLGNYCQLAAKS